MTIIGVNPRRFTGAFSAQETPDVFFPFSMQPIAAPLKIGALILASMGIYSIMAWMVSRRTNEIGIRMALGARSQQVQGMVLREAAWMTLSGVAVGVAGALALGRVVASLLYGLKSWDPMTFAASACC